MVEFYTKYVYALPVEELVGKMVFVSDSLTQLRHAVQYNERHHEKTIVRADTDTEADFDYPFVTRSGASFRYAYYDPYYDVRLAKDQGVPVEHYNSITDSWEDVQDVDFCDAPGCYRVKKELEVGD